MMTGTERNLPTFETCMAEAVVRLCGKKLLLSPLLASPSTVCELALAIKAKTQQEINSSNSVVILNFLDQKQKLLWLPLSKVSWL